MNPAGDFWSYEVVDGRAELSAAARDLDHAAVEELVDLDRPVQADVPDWDDYRAAMVRDRRLVLGLRAERAYGMVHRGQRTQGAVAAGKAWFSASSTGDVMCADVAIAAA